MQLIAQIYVFLLVYAIQENTAVNLKIELKKRRSLAGKASFAYF